MGTHLSVGLALEAPARLLLSGVGDAFMLPNAELADQGERLLGSATNVDGLAWKATEKTVLAPGDRVYISIACEGMGNAESSQL